MRCYSIKTEIIRKGIFPFGIRLWFNNPETNKLGSIGMLPKRFSKLEVGDPIKLIVSEGYYTTYSTLDGRTG